MEILIVGIIVVALMVYTSTKIKNSAAQAYEPEAIETDDFTITKPEGFINPIREDSPFAFEAYTKLSGEKEAREYRHAQAILRIVSDANFKTVRAAAKASADKILSENNTNENAYLLESEKTENGVKIFSFWKIIESNRKIYELEVSVLEKYREEYADRINQMIESFKVK